MKCPHCLVEFHDTRKLVYLNKDIAGNWAIDMYNCPNPSCKKSIYYLILGEFSFPSLNSTAPLQIKYDALGNERIIKRYLIRPKGINRSPIPIEVPKDIAEDYQEACLVLSDSPKASAALSRRCLQNLLRNATTVKHDDLAKEIQQIIDSGKLPSHILESIDAIRNIGNFAAHPIKSQSTGEIVPVEPGEAEWNLDVLEMLFDFYYVQPALIQRRRAALDAKLADIGKPGMK